MIKTGIVGLSIFAILFLLKVFGAVGWSWWWILCPLLLPGATVFWALVNIIAVVTLMSHREYHDDRDDKGRFR